MTNHKMGSVTRRRRKARLFERDGAACAYCGATLTEATATLDHIIPRGKGGSNGLSNLRLACAPCNHSRDQRPVLMVFA